MSKVVLVIKVKIKPEANQSLTEWGGRLNQNVIGTPGFISLDIGALTAQEWVISLRFDSQEQLDGWRKSSAYQELLYDLKEILETNSEKNIEEVVIDSSTLNEGVTEIIISKVHADKVEDYKRWLSKIHKEEARFPGFRGMYVHPPLENKENFWITLLQFDTQENLDNWVNSKVREELIREGGVMVALLERHRIISPYSGWFQSLAKQGETPSAWKQTMLVLLVLYPIVMLEMKYLSPLLHHLKLPVSTFIANAVSVSLISWPLLPLVIKKLSWWLESSDKKKVALGTALVSAAYLLEISIFMLLS